MIEPRKLLAHGRLKLTHARLQVLEGFDERTHATPEELYRRLNHDELRIALPTIYRVLAELVRAGVLDRYDLGQGPARYSLHRDERPIHLVCRECGAVAAHLDARLQAALAKMADAADFTIDAIDVRMTGYCRACRARQRVSKETARE